jgi:hypothetical protein
MILARIIEGKRVLEKYCVRWAFSPLFLALLIERGLARKRPRLHGWQTRRLRSSLDAR